MAYFEIAARSSTTDARAGVLHTDHGVVATPALVPAAILASRISGLSGSDLAAVGASIVHADTYGLFLRPGIDQIAANGGLQRFVDWHAPILTDSGGGEAWRLGRKAKQTEDGIDFQSHIDGSQHLLTPEKSLAIQADLEADIRLCLCAPLSAPDDRRENEAAIDRSTRWAKRSKHYFRQQKDRTQGALFGVVSGSRFPELIRRSAKTARELDFDGYAMTGLDLGASSSHRLDIAAAGLAPLPVDRLRYILHTQSPLELIALTALGADLFDNTHLLHLARDGQLLSGDGQIDIGQLCHRADPDPIDSSCRCYTCRRFSRGYLHHLHQTQELTGYRLNAMHNLSYMLNLLRVLRSAIMADTFDVFRSNFASRPDV